MKYKIIQTTRNGDVYEQTITSYYKMYDLVIQRVSLDYNFIRNVEIEEDEVTIHIVPGEKYAILTFAGLKKLFALHVKEMLQLQRKQVDQCYEHYQKNCEELRQFDKELIEHIKEELGELW